MVKMKCDDIHCWKLLLDLEGTQHNTVSYFTKIIFLLLHWMSYMLYTSPGRGQSKVARAQDLQGKRRKLNSQ